MTTGRWTAIARRIAEWCDQHAPGHTFDPPRSRRFNFAFMAVFALGGGITYLVTGIVDSLSSHPGVRSGATFFLTGGSIMLVISGLCAITAIYFPKPEHAVVPGSREPRSLRPPRGPFEYVVYMRRRFFSDQQWMALALAVAVIGNAVCFLTR